MVTKEFKLQKKQEELFKLIASPAKFILAVGGERSGKTFAMIAAVITRAMQIPNSRHGIFRQTAIAAKDSIFELTLPQVFKLRFPDIYQACLDGRDGASWNRSDLRVTLPNGSVITVGGLDDDARIERLMGMEYTTIYLNEASQLENYKIVTRCSGRLSEIRETISGRQAKTKLLIDCNPPEETHWTCKVFRDGKDPTTDLPLKKPHKYASIQMNTLDNAENLDAEYLSDRESELTGDERDKLWNGVWQIANPNAIFKKTFFKRVAKAPEGLLKIVAVDPSTTETGDECGIMVVGLDQETDRAYLIADYSKQCTPTEWAKIVADAYRDHGCSMVVAERNMGGKMVTAVLHAEYRNLPVKLVWASDAKVPRALPVANLYELGKVYHCGEEGGFKTLEEQMQRFKMKLKRSPGNSPDRVDALVWGLTYLMLDNQYQPAKLTQRQPRWG